MAGEAAEAREVARRKAGDGFMCSTGVLHDVTVLPELGEVQGSGERAREGTSRALRRGGAVQRGTAAKLEIFEVDAEGTEESIATVDGEVGAARAKRKLPAAPVVPAPTIIGA